MTSFRTLPFLNSVFDVQYKHSVKRRKLEMPTSFPTITELPNDCLMEIFKNLNEFDLFALRETDNRFIKLTERCFKRNFANSTFEVNQWHLEFLYRFKYPGHRLNHFSVKVLHYFGRYMRDVHIDMGLLQAIESESYDETFLTRNMVNVRRIRSEFRHTFLQEMHFTSTLKNVEELQIRDNFGLGVWYHWPRLTTLVITYKMDVNDDLFAFLKLHPTIKKLHFYEDIDLERGSGTRLLKVVGNNLPNLIDLNIRKIQGEENLSLICGLSKLENLVINSVENVKPIEKLTKLKRLRILKGISLSNLLKLVEFAPTLNHIDLLQDVTPAIDKIATEELIKKRMLSPYCEMEKLEVMFQDRSKTEDRSKRAEMCCLENKYVYFKYYKLTTWSDNNT